MTIENFVIDTIITGNNNNGNNDNNFIKCI